MTKHNKTPALLRGYDGLLAELSGLIDQARRTSARTVNAIMTATYWRIGRRIVEVEQGGAWKAEYGDVLLVRLAQDLTVRFGRGYAKSNLYQMRAFYLAFTDIFQTVSGKSKTAPRASTLQTPPAESGLQQVAAHFPLPWSAYVRLLSVKNELARRFYETEALRGGWRALV